MKGKIFTLVFLITNLLCYSQNETSLYIKQVALPKGHISEYKYDNNKLVILENSKKIKQIKIDEIQSDDLARIIESINIDSLQERYTRENIIFDGVNRTFIFEKDNKQKKVFLDNYYLEELDELLRFINNKIPEQKKLISYGNKYLKPDTLIEYRPDFCIKNKIYPDTNYSHKNILTYSKGYIDTNSVKNINICECRIYPTHKNGKYLKRVYWKAFKLDDNWDQIYFDKIGNNDKEKHLKILIPYEIVQEKKFSDIGNKPSMTIVRYYKTIIDN